MNPRIPSFAMIGMRSVRSMAKVTKDTLLNILQWLCLLVIYRWSSSSLRCKILVVLVLVGGIVLSVYLRSMSILRKEQSALRLEPILKIEDLRGIAAHHSIRNLEFRTRSAAGLPVTMKIHFIHDSYRINANFKTLLSSWRKVYPDYRMYFWTDREISLLISQRYPPWGEMYHCHVSNYVERSYVSRAFVLEAMGGWYADLDTGCLSRADRLASKHALILPLEPYLHALNNFRMHRLVSNAIMYSVPQHPFWTFFLNGLRYSLLDKKPRQSIWEAVETTGHVPLTNHALIFLEANKGRGCPGRWCPHLPPPVQFLPLYNNSIPATRDEFRKLCKKSWFLTKQFESKEFDEECLRFAPYDFDNYQLDPGLSHSYREFVYRSDSEVDVRDLGFDLVHGQRLVAEIGKLLRA